MITKCPFPCIVKSNYGNCVAGRCMNSQYKSMWNGDELDQSKLKQYQDQTKSTKEKNMSKFRYPKCPYCKTEYTGWRMGDYTLMRLATNGDVTEAIHLCDHCGKKYKITVKIMYYGAKIDRE